MKARQRGDDELKDIQNASFQIECKKLFANSQIKHFT